MKEGFYVLFSQLAYPDKYDCIQLVECAHFHSLGLTRTNISRIYGDKAFQVFLLTVGRIIEGSDSRGTDNRGSTV